MERREITLIKVDSNANNNKFYRVEMDEGGSIITTWGRVGNSGQSKTEMGSDRRFDTIVRGKERKGYVRTDVKSTQPSRATVGQRALRDVATAQVAGGVSTGPLASAVQFMVDANRHDIIKTSGGLLTVDDSGVVKTPLGIIGTTALTDASSVLDRVSALGPRATTSREKLTNQYLALVPQKVSGRDWATTFLDDDGKVDAQRTLLRQLRSSLDWYENQASISATTPTATQDTAQYDGLFEVRLGMVDGTDEFGELDAFYRKTLNRMHTSHNLNLLHAYSLTYGDDTNRRFQDLGARLGNVQRLWHGTDAGNVLSILREGLYCPPLNASKFNISGRMFGPGVYLSTQSTKSLNYAYGYWKGTRNSRCFMFVTEAIMGNEYAPRSGFSTHTAHNGKDHRGRTYDSIYIKGGTNGVANDESIIWNTSQIQLKYLLEFGA